jgi:hypothetical protein
MSIPRYSSYGKRNDGFGAQFQNIIEAIIVSETEGSEYVHNPIEQIEHNYNNDPSFIDNIEKLMNIKGNYKTIDVDVSSNDVEILNMQRLYGVFESNIDYYLQSDSCKKYKKIFWSNKDVPFFKNDYTNVAVHIRRPNRHDNRIDGSDTPDAYYIYVMNHIINSHPDKKILFHIYSQGDINHFKVYSDIFPNVVFHLNEDVCSTFTGLVGSDILVMSRSSFSYAAALIHDGIVYYCPFWHINSLKWLQI